jgi:hypothetical protein
MADGYARASGKPGVALCHYRTGSVQYNDTDGASLFGFRVDVGVVELFG